MANIIIAQHGILSVTAKYLHKVKGSDNYYFIRRLPADVLRKLKASGQKPKTKVVITTSTSNRQTALREATRINAALEGEWNAIRQGQPTSNTVSDAKALVTQYVGMPFDLSDYLDTKLSSTANHKIHEVQHSVLPSTMKQEELDAILKQQLTEVEWQAVQIARGHQVWSLSILRDEYINLKGWNNNRKQRNSVNAAFEPFITTFGDITPNSISRLEVHQLVQNLIEQGVKTATVRRKIGVICAAINYVTRMQEVELNNPFTFVEIPNLNEDAVDRVDFSSEQLQSIRSMVTKGLETDTSNSIVGVIAMMIDTGMRLSEVVGLKVEDINLDGDVPYVNLHKNSMRRLKTKNSQRLIPLVGTSLEWITAQSFDTEYVFSRYVDEANSKLKNTAASAIVNKRLKSWIEVAGGNSYPTAHSFRHTLNTRLRNAQCPKDIREELGGWAKSISDGYGSATDLKIKQGYLLKTL